MSLKIYQLVNHEDGTRSEVLTAPGLSELAQSLRNVTLDRPVMVDFYVLVLMEDVAGTLSPSRAPMMRVSTVIEIYGDKS